MSITESLSQGYELGVIHYKGEYTFYMNPSAWFVMDYARYDPDAAKDRNLKDYFRDGILVVDDFTAEAYMHSMKPDAVSVDELRAELPQKKDSLQPIFLIDFDNHRYVSWYFDIDYEEYIPSGWEGVFENPLGYLSDEVRKIWEPPGAPA